MKKINRRDYLLRMGAGAGAILSASKLDQLAQGQSKAQNSQGVATAKRKSALFGHKPYESWSLTPDRPYLPSVRVYFWGLMAFSYKGGVAEIGIHSSNHAHRFDVAIAENCQWTYQTPTGGFPPESLFKLGIDSKAPDVKFYAPGTFNRKSSTTDRHDFRWLPDLESNEFYGKKLSPLRPRIYKKRLQVKHGTFLTHLRSESTFDIVGGPKPKTDVYWARVVTLQVELDAQEQLTLELPSETPRHFSKADGKLVEIFFVNQCYDGASVCPDSDFEMNFDATTLAASSKFKLKLKSKQTGPPTGTCLDSNQEALSARVLFNSDEAPCMGSGFGQGELPTYPPG